MDALEPFRVASPKQEPAPLSYLADKNPNTAYDIHLEVRQKKTAQNQETIQISPKSY